MMRSHLHSRAQMVASCSRGVQSSLTFKLQSARGTSQPDLHSPHSLGLAGQGDSFWQLVQGYDGRSGSSLMRGVPLLKPAAVVGRLYGVILVDGGCSG